MLNSNKSPQRNIPIVLVHGTCGISEDWSHVLRVLSQERTVIRPDYGRFCREQGLATSPTVADYVFSVTAELEKLGVERFDLFGASLGAAIAVAIAAEHPERVNSMVVQSGFMLGSDTRLTLLFDLWLHLAIRDRASFTKLILASGFSHRYLASFDQATLEGIIEGFINSAEWSLIEEAIRVDMRLDIRDAATRIKAPTLIISTRQDQIVPPSYSDALASLIPHANRYELECGHLAFLERPNELATALLEFFNVYISSESSKRGRSK